MTLKSPVFLVPVERRSRPGAQHNTPANTASENIPSLSVPPLLTSPASTPLDAPACSSKRSGVWACGRRSVRRRGGWGRVRDALEAKAPPRQPQQPLDKRLEEVFKAVAGGYRGRDMPSKLALAVRETVAGHRLGALEGGGGAPPPLPVQPWGSGEGGGGAGGHVNTPKTRPSQKPVRPVLLRVGVAEDGIDRRTNGPPLSPMQMLQMGIW